jgi:hypothetical protein
VFFKTFVLISVSMSQNTRTRIRRMAVPQLEESQATHTNVCMYPKLRFLKDRKTKMGMNAISRNSSLRVLSFIVALPVLLGGLLSILRTAT